MSFEAGVRSNPRASDVRSPDFRQPLSVIGRAYEPGITRERASAGPVRRFFGAALELVLPVLLLAALGVASVAYGDRGAALPGGAGASWLTLGHLLLPLTFLAIHLTNRRYGAGHAFAQTMLGWALGLGVLWAMREQLPVLLGRALPDLHLVFAFGSALLIGQLFSVLVFDRTRGPRWWTAPLLATLAGGLLFCGIAFPGAYVGTSVDWIGRMLTYGGYFVAASVALLLPYGLLRRCVPPRSGLGGY
ncbi:MAG: VUT family protein [Alphaproteobacteria bacterium]|nr:VUT family protein [Alphaproteobacteria bacterium]MDE2352804.1 VUT family protein [Alphaproteobacteria bacterium]